jgi:hypothetical protein
MGRRLVIISPATMSFCVMKPFFIRLAELSFSQWTRLIVPYSSLVVAISFLLSIRGHEGQTFSSQFVGHIQGAFQGTLILIVCSLLVLFGWRRKTGARLSDRWLIYALWCIVFSAVVTLQNAQIGWYQEPVLGGLVTIAGNTLALEHLQKVASLFTGSVVFHLFIAAMMEAFFQMTRYYATLIDVFSTENSAADREQAPCSQIPTTAENRLLNNIVIDSISFIEVKGNFRSIVHEFNGEWKTLGSYDSLKDVETAFPDFFFKINRSVLINPAKIESLKKVDRQYEVAMAGADTPFMISRSLNRFVRDRLGG